MLLEAGLTVDSKSLNLIFFLNAWLTKPHVHPPNYRKALTSCFGLTIIGSHVWYFFFFFFIYWEKSSFFFEFLDWLKHEKSRKHFCLTSNSLQTPHSKTWLLFCCIWNKRAGSNNHKLTFYGSFKIKQKQTWRKPQVNRPLTQNWMFKQKESGQSFKSGGTMWLQDVWGVSVVDMSPALFFSQSKKKKGCLTSGSSQ